MEKEVKNTLNWKAIGQRFRDLRERYGYTQSKITGINNNPKNISEFEIGSAPASTNYALFLRNEFGASFDWLYCGIEVDIPKTDRTKKRVLDAHAIGVRLKAVRKKKRMTQKQFAEWIGITNQNISDYERGECKPEIKTAILIREALKKPLDWIYFGDEPIIPISVKRARSDQIRSIISRIQEKVKVVTDVLHNFLQLFSVFGGVEDDRFKRFRLVENSKNSNRTPPVNVFFHLCNTKARRLVYPKQDTESIRMIWKALKSSRRYGQSFWCFSFFAGF